MRSHVFHVVVKFKERTFNKSFFQYNGGLVHYFGNESIRTSKAETIENESFQNTLIVNTQFEKIG